MRWRWWRRRDADGPVEPGVTVGKGCLIAEDAIVGARAGRDGLPTLGDRVIVGAGAKILGPVTVGDAAIVAPEALVLADVPAGAVVRGLWLVPRVEIEAVRRKVVPRGVAHRPDLRPPER